MNILQVHNFYRQAGGEDRVVAAEKALLADHGHRVFQYTLHNDSLNEASAIGLGLKTVWNGASHDALGKMIGELDIDILHAHNTLPLISPSVYYAAAKRGVPVVQTLHNYRLLCPAATLYRAGEICELCVPAAIKRQAVKHRCYRNSLSASAAVTAMLAVHRLAGTYSRRVHTYIALTEFARKKFIEGGLPAERITVKRNFLETDPGIGNGSVGFAVFVGRLSAEKGLAPLLDVWEKHPGAVQLRIAGDGPLESFVRERSSRSPNVQFLGARSRAEVFELLKEAAFLVFPSRWYEGMPMVLLEAMACGTPAVASAVGSLNELIVEGENGVKLPLDSGAALSGLLSNSAELTAKMRTLRAGARAYFERNFTARANYPLLLDIYNRALRQPCQVS